jgi:peptidoglycan hydrolase-like protein with peptidoglycan-binding domain
MSPHNDVAAPARWRASLRRSHERRAAAMRSRRRRLRGRTLAIAAAASMTAISGVAVATDGDSTSSAETSSSRATLQVGSTGAAVKKLQRKLGVSPTGYYGSQTRAAVRRFQRRKGLKADGIAGPRTLRKLGIRVSASSYSTGGAEPSDESGESGSSPRLPRILRRIARCESGGNPRAISPDGRYRGKYQFDRATWRAWGGSGDPAAAPESVQDRIALKLYRARGTAPWPNCP